MKKANKENKYLLFLKSIGTDKINTFDFDVDFAKLMSELDDKRKTKEYTREQWDELYNWSKDMMIPLSHRNALNMALMYAYYVPEDIKTEIIKKIYKYKLPRLLLRDDNTVEQVQIIVNRLIKDFSIQSICDEHTNQRNLEYMLDLPGGVLKRLKYKPYQYIDGKKWNDKIYCMLVNKDGDYNEDLDEDFYTAVINNKSLSVLTRNIASKMEYIPTEIEAFTKGVARSIYEQAVETLFMNNESTKNEIIDKAKDSIKKLIDEDKMSEKMYENLFTLAMQKVKEDGIDNVRYAAYYILKSIMNNVKYENIIDMIIPNILFYENNILTYILLENKQLNSRQFSQIIENLNDENTHLIMQYGNNKKLDKDIFEQNYDEDEFGFIYMCNRQCPKEIETKILEKVKEDNKNDVCYIHTEKYKALLMSRYIKEELLKKNDIFSEKEMDIILNLLFQTICKKDKSISASEFYNEVANNLDYNEALIVYSMSNMEKEKVDCLTHILDDTKKLYPSCNEIISSIKDEIKENYKVKDFFVSHKDFIEIMFNSFNVEDMQIHIDIDVLANYTDKEKEKFMNDIRNVKNKKIIEIFFEEMLNQLKAPHIPENKLFKWIYELADIYECLEEGLKKQDEKQLEEEIEI